jgi:hypothetical protein
MTLALLESVQRISEKGIAGGATEGEDTEAIVKYAELEKALKRLTKNLEKAIKLAKGRFQF